MNKSPDEFLSLNLNDSWSATTIIYHKILSYGIYYFNDKSIAEWFIKQHKINGTLIYLIEESEEFLGNTIIRYAVKYDRLSD